MSDPRDKIASDFLKIAQELADASKHAEVASRHFSNKEVPRGCAHVAAIQGHILVVENLIEEFQITHSKHAKPD